ncbi:MAG: DEAD/DEAH box helicase [Chitinophagaceae bacterium]|nr:DEAD/DEAH box helicase [Chitinophagaceae bacterium]
MFETLPLNRQLLNAIQDLGFTTPTPIQMKAIPLINAGRNILAIAQTGTGKTAAYLLPILYKIKFAQERSPIALIIAPTRELVMQIEQHCILLAKYTNIRITSFFGGKNPKKDAAKCEKGIDIIVSTPARFLEIYHLQVFSTKFIKTLVLDEADKIMDMGFIHQIRNILEIIPSKKRQNLLFSATIPQKVIQLSEEFLEFPEKIDLSQDNITPLSIQQNITFIPNLKTKIHMLEWILIHKVKENERVILFTKTKQRATEVCKFLQRKITKSALVIHGNKDQNTRINALNSFRKNETQILVTTDITARGIDIPEVMYVINFDVPLIYEDYIHRIGRTGRVNQQGTAWTFVSPEEEHHIKKIEHILKKKIQIFSIPQEVEVTPTPKEERQDMNRKIDTQMKKENPNFQGAFHKKKKNPVFHHKKTNNK